MFAGGNGMPRSFRSLPSPLSSRPLTLLITFRWSLPLVIVCVQLVWAAVCPSIFSAKFLLDLNSRASRFAFSDR
jgi:hypothetical protein